MRHGSTPPRMHRAVFRNASPSAVPSVKVGGGPSVSSEEVLHSLVFLLCLQRHLRQSRIERAKDRLRLLPVPKGPSTYRTRVHARFLQLHPMQLNSDEAQQQTFYRAVPRVLGQYVRRVIGFSGGLNAYLFWQGRERLMAARLADALPRIPPEELHDYYRDVARSALEAEVHACVALGRWLKISLSRRRFTACLSHRPRLERATRHGPLAWVEGAGQGFFLIVERRGEEGGRIAAVHEASRFDRIARTPRVTARQTLRSRPR